MKHYTKTEKEYYKRYDVNVAMGILVFIVWFLAIALLFVNIYVDSLALFMFASGLFIMAISILLVYGFSETYTVYIEIPNKKRKR